MLSFNSLFRTVEHVAPGQHIREYSRATAEPDDTLSIAVKQYIPIENPNPQPGDVTIIGAHANGFPKVCCFGDSLFHVLSAKCLIQELYEPLWEEILIRSRGKFRIKSIWIADVAFQGASGVMNEGKLGNDPSWMDPPRDLLHFINLKREEFSRPIVNLALMHPRPFHSIVMMDPVITRPILTTKPMSYHNLKFYNLTITQASTYRRDIWPSRRAAADFFAKSPFYQAWDPRVLERWVKYGLRDLPTLIHPLPEETKRDEAEKPVTLTTSKHQEVFTFSRPAYSPQHVTCLTHPDFVLGVTGNYPFYRAEPDRTLSQLPYLRPSVFYLFGDESDLSTPKEIEEKLRTTGVGPGGSGGVAAGRVSHHTFHGVGHMIPMEVVNESAEQATSFLDLELKRFKSEEETLAMAFKNKTAVEKTTMDEEWYKHMSKPVRPPKEPQAKI
ncbi:hypothetical protein KEM54_002690 [Ascosphaera aggregata]|nr:hypothetical protein KEM54_002690 [Ascosphaera aggregata]